MEFEDDITCPECGARDEEHGDYPPALEHDGDEVVFECHACGHVFLVVLSVSYSFGAVNGPDAFARKAIGEQKQAAYAQKTYEECRDEGRIKSADYWAALRQLHSARARQWLDDPRMPPC